MTGEKREERGSGSGPGDDETPDHIGVLLVDVGKGRGAQQKGIGRVLDDVGGKREAVVYLVRRLVQRKDEDDDDALNLMSREGMLGIGNMYNN